MLEVSRLARGTSGVRAASFPSGPYPRAFYDVVREYANEDNVRASLARGIESCLLLTHRIPKDVVEWMRGTGLRPFLDPLDEEGRSRFLKAYHRKLETAYAPLDNGSVLFAMPRLFVVAVAANR